MSECDCSLCDPPERQAERERRYAERVASGDALGSGLYPAGTYLRNWTDARAKRTQPYFDRGRS